MPLKTLKASRVEGGCNKNISESTFYRHQLTQSCRRDDAAINPNIQQPQNW